MMYSTVVTIRYPTIRIAFLESRYDTIRITILAENCKLDCEQWQLKLMSYRLQRFVDIFFPCNGFSILIIYRYNYGKKSQSTDKACTI